MPGDRVVVRGGRHRIPSSSTIPGVEIVAEGRVRITPTSTTRRRRHLSFIGDGLVLRGLEFRRAEVSVRGDGVVVENCVLRGVRSLDATSSALGVLGDGAVVAGNLVDRTCRAGTGIRVAGERGSISGNRVEARVTRAGVAAQGPDATVEGNVVLRGSLRILGDGGLVHGNEVADAALGQASLLVVGDGNEVLGNQVAGGLDTGFLVVGDSNRLSGNSVADNGSVLEGGVSGHGFVVRGSGNLLTGNATRGCAGEGFRVVGNGVVGLVEDPDSGALRPGPIPLGPGNVVDGCTSSGAGICGIANLTVGTVVTASSFLGNRVDVAAVLAFEVFADNDWETGGPLFAGDGVCGAFEDTLGSEFLPAPPDAGPAPAPTPKAGSVRPVTAQEFQPGPSLAFGRAHHTATALPGGGVLVAGGQAYAGTPIASTEVWTPETEAFEAAGPLAAARRMHAAARLPDGRILVCGGFGGTGATLASAEIFDPASRTWSPAAPMAEDRARHTATALADGRVLVAGGYTNATGVLQFAASNGIYDPWTGEWSVGPAPVVARGGHTATRLADGRVLLVGGARFGQAVAEIFDPVAGTLTRTAGDPAHHRLFHDAALTASGVVLVAGGGAVFAETFDPATGSFSPAGATPVFGLAVTDSVLHGTLVPIPGDRTVLIGGLAAGGAPGGGDLAMASVLLWDGRAVYGYGSAFPMPFDLAVPRAAHTVTPIEGGFLVVGGLGTSGEGAGNERRTTLFRPLP